MKFLFLLIAVALAFGCEGCTLFSSFAPVEISKHPDAPMLILQAKGDYLRVAVYSSKDNKMIEYGWIQCNESIKGWTLTKYDWEAFIKKKEAENGNN